MDVSVLKDCEPYHLKEVELLIVRGFRRETAIHHKTSSRCIFASKHYVLKLDCSGEQTKKELEIQATAPAWLRHILVPILHHGSIDVNRMTYHYVVQPRIPIGEYPTSREHAELIARMRAFVHSWDVYEDHNCALVNGRLRIYDYGY